MRFRSELLGDALLRGGDDRAKHRAQIEHAEATLTDECSAQLRKAYLDTERVDAKANVALFRACKSDIKSLNCYGGDKNAEDVIECLRAQKKNLQPR